MPKLIIEGWRFLPHSYAVVNQWTCLALLRRPDIDFKIRDLPYFQPHWAPVGGLFPAGEEAALRALPIAAPEERAETTMRIWFPFDFTPAGKRTWVYGTTEVQCMPQSWVRGDLANLRNESVGVITPSQWSKRGFVNGGVDERRVFVVPIGVDTRMFRPRPDVRETIRKQLNLPGFTFLNVGGMIPNKGIDLLFRALAAVVERYPDVRLVLKGADSLYNSKDIVSTYLNALPVATQEKVQSRVIYIGNSVSMENMASLYQCADAYVSPYRAEGFNMPVLEAMASGLPVICTEGGSTDDFTRPDFTLRVFAATLPINYCDTPGVMLEPNLEHLTAQMIRAIEDEAWCRQAGTRGAAFAQDNLGWDKVTGDLLKVILGEGGA